MSELQTCFKKVDYDLAGLLHYIDIGDIGLPDIQRPFVWTNTKVRDLFDSMYHGFPVGYLLFWQNTASNGEKQIGIDQKQHDVPRLLIVDGQQRLTSLYAVVRGKKVLDKDFAEREIEVAFRPKDGKFEVSDAAIRLDPEFIPDITKIWATNKSSYSVIKNFLGSIRAKREVSEVEEEQISQNIDRLYDLVKYPFTALEIAAAVPEEQVADIFVRINSQGVKLNQADFILTLLSVFWDEGRADLERFCELARKPPANSSTPSPFNHFLEPDPDQLVRVAIAIGFNRARLKSVYNVLRGKDPDSGEFLEDLRNAQFAILKMAQAQALDLTNWHQFLSALVGAGYRSAEMVSSNIALIYSYAFYILGKERYHVPEHQLQKLIGRWFIANTLTNRYSGPFESTMESDLNKLKEVSDADGFVRVLEEIMGGLLTNDFWNITLPQAMNNSSARDPATFAYLAAQNMLVAPILFSHKHIGDLLDPTVKLKKKSIDRHHLFPRGYLEKQGITDLKQINQVANFAMVEWPENISISDAEPSDYVPRVRSRFTGEDWAAMQKFHALPDGWENMNYQDFLAARRGLMAGIIRKGYESLK